MLDTTISQPGAKMRSSVARSVGSVFLVALLAACTDTDTVFVERPFFDDPPAASSGFLGYGTVAARAESFTVCGNCHIGKQSAWERTRHADAWATLEASGQSQPFCEGCHTISERGNAAEGDVAWTATGDPRYHDVQCESCHGPGSGHVSNPDASQPLASAAVGSALQNGCGECHSGTHHPFVEEWEASPHAGVVGFAAARPECAACHRGQATLAAWGEDAEYLEKNASEALPVVCAVCHDPHGSDNTAQLRFPVQTTSIEEHLCARCHNRRTEPDASTHGLEPHAPEAALLVGDAGWFPPDANIDRGQIRGTHGSGANEKLCATCHVSRFEVTDAETGEFTFQATGHLFRPIPCVGPDGVPLGFEDDCPLSATARSFTSCTSSGTGLSCHGDAQAAFSALTTKVNTIQGLADELHDLLVQVDPNLEAAGGAIDPENPTFTVAEGAFFNLELAEFGSATFGTNTVVGSTAHNPFLIEALLVASIRAVEDEYNVSASIQRADLEARLEEIRTETARIR